jgi:predicted small metal-binding protein
MAKVLICRETGTDCDYIVRGQTEEEVLRDAAKHVKEVHGFMDAQVSDSQTQRLLRSLIRDARP